MPKQDKRLWELPEGKREVMADAKLMTHRVQMGAVFAGSLCWQSLHLSNGYQGLD